MKPLLDGCVALVTGAAQGIGEAIVRRFAAEGAELWLADIDEPAGEALAAELRRSGVTANFCRLDISDEAAWQATIERIRRECGGLDILVNNAGIAVVEPIEATTLASFQRVMRINVEGVFLGIKTALPALRERAGRRRGGAAIVNLASVLGARALPDNVAYGTSKAAVMQLGKCAAIEFAKARYGIRVNAVLPAVTDTPMVARELEEWAREGTLGTHDVEGTKAAFGARVPIGRIGTPAEIANAVLFLASDESSFMTGADVAVDGGRMAA